MPRIFLLTVVLALSGAVYAQDGGQQTPNVVLITVDTLRADHVSSYGYHLKTTPNIDELASEGVRFAKAYSAIPLTGPSHFSLLTSRYPQEHGARINGISALKNGRLLFLPQVLKGHDYHTAAFVSAWPLTSRLTGLDEYFDVYDEDLPRQYQVFNSMRWAEDVTPNAITWLKANYEDGPFFLWVHYFDPHEPYNLREGYTNLEQLGPASYPGLDMNDDDTRDRIQRYDSEIGYADHYIGILLDTLDELGLRDSTLVALTADHGESLGEHGYVGHGRQLYEPVVHVPLIMRLPGVAEAGKVVNEEVSLIDLTPTIIDVALRTSDPDLKLPIELGGRSFAAGLNGGSVEAETVRYLTYGGKKGFFPRWVSFMWTDLDSRPLMVGRTTGTRKVIWAMQDQQVEIIDLAADPHELAVLKPDRGSDQYRLESGRLDRWYQATVGEAGENRMTEEDMEVLKSLGYVQ